MNKEFEVHKLNEQGFAKVTELAHGFDALLTAILAWIPASRELSIVRTKLEEACFFAKKGIANVPENQQ
jgi:hypothetical protein